MSAMTRNRIARYTDSTEVQEGDSIRYKQAPGGMLPASGEWRHGTAQRFPHTEERRASMLAYSGRMGETMLDPDELHLHDDGHYYHIVGHIVERDTEELSA